MKLIPATLETLEALPRGTIVTPITEFYNDYVFLKHNDFGDEPWSDVGISEGHTTSEVLRRCTMHQQTQLIQLWPAEDSDILVELQALREQSAHLTSRLTPLEQSRTAADEFLRQLRMEHDGLTARVFDDHVRQDATNRGFTARIDAVSERSSREETFLAERLEQQDRMIQELQSRQAYASASTHWPPVQVPPEIMDQLANPEPSLSWQEVSNEEAPAHQDWRPGAAQDSSDSDTDPGDTGVLDSAG